MLQRANGHHLASARRQVKTLVYRTLQATRIAPTPWLLENPLKIYEFEMLAGAAGLRKDHTVLDLGCGRGIQTQLLARRCARAIGVDIGEEQIEAARRLLRHSCVKEKVEFVCAPIQEANLPPAFLDRVFSICVLEHIPALASVLATIRMLLKPGAELHVSVDSLAPFVNSALLAQHRREHDVVQYFTPESIERQLRVAGFDVLEISPLLTSAFAEREFEKRIRCTHYGYPLFRRMQLVRRLRRAEAQSRSSRGIWLIARARRPNSDMDCTHAQA